MNICKKLLMVCGIVASTMFITPIAFAATNTTEQVQCVPETFEEFSQNCMGELFEAYQYLQGISSFCAETYPKKEHKHTSEYLICRAELKRRFHKENKISYMCKAITGIKTDDPLLESYLHSIFYQRPMHPDF